MKKIIIALCMVFFVIMGYKISLVFFKKDQANSDLKTEIFIKNNSFSNEYTQNAPFKKGDKIEINIIVQNLGDVSKKIQLKTDVLEKNILLPGKIPNTFTLEPNETSQIQISGTAKEQNTLSGNSLLEEESIKENSGTLLPENINFSGGTIYFPQREKQSNTQSIILPSPPTIKSYSSNINNLISFKKTGTSISHVLIGEKSFPVILSDEKNIYINVEALTFDSGEYFTVFVSNENQLIPQDEKISFVLNKNTINITNITPPKISSQTEKNLVLQGNGFQKLVGIQLSNNLILKKIDFDIVNDKVLIVKIPKGLEKGNYSFNLMDTQRIYELNDKTFDVQ